MMNLRGIDKKILIFITLITVWVSTVPFCRALEIEIKEKATVKGDTVLLGDIASFSPETDPRVPELKGLELGAAPYPGQALALNSRYLISRLGVGITDADIQVKMPQDLLVERAAQVVYSLQMKRIFKDYILNQAPWPAADITLEAVTTPGRLVLPEGRLEWRIGEKNHDDYIGNVHLVLTFLVDGKPVRKASISGKVRVRQKVLRAARDLRPGDVVAKEDLHFSDEEMTYIPEQALEDINEIIGKRVVRSIRTDQFITAGMVEDPPVVKKGGRVLIKAESDRVLITTIGRVLEDGRTGDLVKVVNVASGKEIFATVKGPELVEVSF